MNIQLLQWGLFSFMQGLILSLPLAAVYYQNSPQWTKIFINPRKLKSAHLDFFTQAFAIGFCICAGERCEITASLVCRDTFSFWHDM
jgi:ABC-type sulfate transport system permease component